VGLLAGFNLGDLAQVGRRQQHKLVLAPDGHIKGFSVRADGQHVGFGAEPFGFDHLP